MGYSDDKVHFTDKHRKELADKGYTVLENAVPKHNAYKRELTQWMEESFGEGCAPFAINSLVRGYQIGHLPVAWKVRLDVKQYFSQVWQFEDELLSSMDTVIVGQPPEYGYEEFDRDDLHWLHVDQTAARKGIHAYQGAVYLETADIDDWTFEVIEGSNNFVETFYKTHREKALKSAVRDLYRLQSEDIEWFQKQGCIRKRVAATAGSLLLWDSRLVHANARPIRGREHPDRWRMAVLVCMAPRRFATERDLESKRQAYENLELTTHWPCDDVATFSSKTPSYAPKSKLPPMTSHPHPGNTVAAKQLAGVLPYPEKQEDPTFKPLRPQWDFELRPDMAERLKGKSSLLSDVMTRLMGTRLPNKPSRSQKTRGVIKFVFGAAVSVLVLSLIVSWLSSR